MVTLRKIISLSLVVSLLSLALAGCASVSSRAAGDMTSIANSREGEPPEQIALLLPLKGRYASQASAIRNGFFAAYYDAKPRLSNPPRIKVYDTANGDIQQVYDQAVNDGAKFVVGPLTKADVTVLAHHRNLPVPTLALNNLDSNSFTRNLYQFGLSPADEAQQVAQRIFSEGKKRIGIIAANDALNQRIANAFEQQWQTLSGVVTKRINYASQKTLANEIKSFLNVDEAYANKSALQRILGEKVHFTPRRREDIDAIFIAAQPNDARQIRPMLSYYYAQNLPVYATSQVYSGQPNPRRDRDLDGVQFCDSPWNLTPDHMEPQALNQIRTNLISLWPKSFSQHSKLYAFGVDAYDMIPYLNQMNYAKLNAATGALYLRRDQSVARELKWARMVNGMATPAS